VDGERTWSEPAIIPTTFVQADATGTALGLADALGLRDSEPHDSPVRTVSSWAAEWCEADRVADMALNDWLAQVEARSEPFEGMPFSMLGALLPDGAMLWAGNSMPVRDMDDWLSGSDRAIRPLSNRGANGIDGVVSTALGAAAADLGPVVLVVGDLSFLHDLNALVTARLHGLSATIVLIDNDGGGIFSFLPQATTIAPEIGLPDHYEELFGTPHGIDVGPVVTALGGSYRSLGVAEMRAALADSIGRPGVQVLGFRTTRDRNVELHHEASAAVAAAIVSR
jgi:2-succinyl-5-enolpyruvyl-6-hydroxy-3-cyclohexene-1-carboxylate synthase